jgi:hypothetical protein
MDVISASSLPVRMTSPAFPIIPPASGETCASRPDPVFVDEAALNFSRLFGASLRWPTLPRSIDGKTKKTRLAKTVQGGVQLGEVSGVETSNR